VLVVTLWGNDQSVACREWREMVQANETVKPIAARFERVEWLYGKLNGPVIPWTKAHGGTSDDPKVQVFVVEHDGRVVARASDADIYEPKPFALFLRDQADAWDRTHPHTRVPFRPVMVIGEGTGAARKLSCPALDEAKETKTPAAVYVWRRGVEGEDAKGKAEGDGCRRFEKDSLGSAEAAKAAEGWALFVLDRADADQAEFAKALGVEAAPGIVLVVPGEPKPVLLDKGISGSNLAYQFRKYAPAKPK
jgi:hypothetical protein